MRAPRLPVLSALLILLLTAGRCNQAALPPDPERTEGRPDTRLDGGRGPRTETPTDLTPEREENKSHQILEVFPRDLRHKEKFLKHLTGPLYFNPKCRKHFYRLYHNTRDCTIPAYYKRCARLLTRLASSPRCTER